MEMTKGFENLKTENERLKSIGNEILHDLAVSGEEVYEKAKENRKLRIMLAGTVATCVACVAVTAVLIFKKNSKC